MADYVFDLESNGFLGVMTRIHVLVIRDFQTRETWTYRHNDTENNIEEGVTRLMTADRLIGQNIIRFDLPAIKKIFPWFKHDAEILDTLVLCRVAAPDIKRSDIALWKKGLLPGDLVGSHSLDAWGIRLGKFKGDYSKQMKAKGLDPWAAWNQEMEDYCVNDVDVTEVLYHQLCSQDINVQTSNLEHEVHDVANDMETHGFPFDIAAAQALAAKLQSEIEDLRQKVVVEYGAKFVPEKRKQIAAYWYDPDGVNLKKERQGKYAMPNTTWGEDKSRKWWGEITVPKMNRTVTKPEYPSPVQFTKDAAYCRAKWIDFNPTSRAQVVDRLVTEHDWTPVDFTEKGGPSLDAAVLETLVERVPAAKTIGELFFLQKLHGQIATGPKSWINSYNPITGCVHPYTDTGGTVTGRCSHSNPNIGQVPAVMVGKDKKPKLGREGEYGWECRSLFHVPPQWKQVGVDLSGIEFRCLAHLTAEFDGGELIEVVLTGDIHQFNMDKTGIPSRDIVKRVLYGLLYGAGDMKLGLTAKPTATPDEAMQIGVRLRAQLMAGLPALKKAIDKIRAQASHGKLIGLDGRVLSVRSEHSALNTRLQSDAALIAKKWLCLIRERAMDNDWQLGWNDGTYDGDLVLLAFVHDEIQAAVAPDYVDIYKTLAIQAAADAGTFFNFRCPVGAEAKVGQNWAQCH